jgi:hypothetical protein
MCGVRARRSERRADENEMRRKVLATVVALSMVVGGSMTANAATQGLWYAGCSSGRVCFRKSSDPAGMAYTSTSDSDWHNDWVGIVGANQFRQRMNSYNVWQYRLVNWSEGEGCWSPEGTNAPWRWIDPMPVWSHKVLMDTGQDDWYCYP